MHRGLLLQASAIALAAMFTAGCTTPKPVDMPLGEADQATIKRIAVDPRVSIPKDITLRGQHGTMTSSGLASSLIIGLIEKGLKTHEKNTIKRTHQGTNSIDVVVSESLPKAVEDALRARVAIEVLPWGQDVGGADAALMLQIVSFGLTSSLNPNETPDAPGIQYGVYMDLAAILIRNPPCEVTTNETTHYIEPVDVAKHPVIWRRFTNLDQCKRLPSTFPVERLADDTDLLQSEFTNIIWALSQDLVKTLPQKPSPAQPLIEKARTDKQGALGELWNMRKNDKISQDEYMESRSKIEKL